ncbi:hypothetical protein GEV33_010836 [Tenebrio molitor]|uniref:Uncharacterized protein n=1 Tax=Tenebrio molitor TaxID=7067 RepID=A0A8J6HDZ3_TENMO|nr:hypothetical protein GEV33_010836 [Tenebrio molitor]
MGTYRGEEPRARSLVDAEQEADEGDDVVLDEGLVEEGVEHAGAEDAAGGEGKSEHVGDVRAALLLPLQRKGRR